jgi:hypothetical protein
MIFLGRKNDLLPFQDEFVVPLRAGVRRALRLRLT